MHAACYLNIYELSPPAVKKLLINYSSHKSWTSPVKLPECFQKSKRVEYYSIAALVCTFTCHRVEELVGLEVGEGGEAAGTPEGSAVGGVSLICLNASSHVIQFILDHIDQYPKKM